MTEHEGNEEARDFIANNAEEIDKAFLVEPGLNLEDYA